MSLKMKISYDGSRFYDVKRTFNSEDDCYGYAYEKGQEKGCYEVAYIVYDENSTDPEQDGEYFGIGY